MDKQEAAVRKMMGYHHTELPWKVTTEGSHAGHQLTIVSDERDEFIASLTNIMVGEGDLDEANANFIVHVANNHYQLLAALEASEAYAARITGSTPPWSDCAMGGCQWCSDCANRVINMRRDAIRNGRQ
ncbi:hypothetical protein LCGC14_3105150 [marine sediment metagenome]|uniref:Uncharacterized protein n=1 Tax=marine sediment metagenome TaxID=412755 RepID=A0A0F8W702_9ZZZZ